MDVSLETLTLLVNPISILNRVEIALSLSMIVCTEVAIARLGRSTLFFTNFEIIESNRAERLCLGEQPASPTLFSTLFIAIAITRLCSQERFCTESKVDWTKLFFMDLA